MRIKVVETDSSYVLSIHRDGKVIGGIAIGPNGSDYHITFVDGVVLEGWDIIILGRILTAYGWTPVENPKPGSTSITI